MHRCKARALLWRFCVLAILLLPGGCSPYCITRESPVFEPHEGLRVIDSVAVPDSGWWRLRGGRSHFPSQYSLEGTGYSVLLETSPLRTHQPSLFVVSALSPDGDSLTLRGAGVGKGNPGTGISYFVRLSEQPEEVDLTIEAPSGEVLGHARLRYRLRKHSFICGIETL